MPDPVDAPTKPCHNCRRQRLRCDRSYPHCNKCTSLGKQCLGYGKLFRWTGAVASRGKLAGKTSSAAVHGQEDPGTSPASFPEVRSLSGSPTTSSFFSDASTGSPDSQLQLARRRSPSTEPSCANQYVLIDPLFQDLSSTHRYYLSYCKFKNIHIYIFTSKLLANLSFVSQIRIASARTWYRRMSTTQTPFVPFSLLPEHTLFFSMLSWLHQQHTCLTKSEHT